MTLEKWSSNERRAKEAQLYSGRSIAQRTQWCTAKREREREGKKTEEPDEPGDVNANIDSAVY